MMKKLLLTMIVTMLTFVGAWATDDVVLNFGTGSTWTINYSGGDEVTGVTIVVATPGDLYTIKGDMAYNNNATYNMWHIEGKTVVITGSLSASDVEVLTVSEDPRWSAYAKAKVLNLTEAVLPDGAESTIKTAWNTQQHGGESSLKLPGDDDTPGDTPGDTYSVTFANNVVTFTSSKAGDFASYLATLSASTIPNIYSTQNYDWIISGPINSTDLSHASFTPKSLDLSLATGYTPGSPKVKTTLFVLPKGSDMPAEISSVVEGVYSGGPFVVIIPSSDNSTLKVYSSAEGAVDAVKSYDYIQNHANYGTVTATGTLNDADRTALGVSAGGGEEPGGEEPGGSGDGDDTPTNDFGTASSWSYADGTLTINLNASDDLKEENWGYGQTCPWKSEDGNITKVVIKPANDVEFNTNVLYIFLEGKSATTLDLSNLTDAQINQLKSSQNLEKTSVYGTGRTLILPEEYVFTKSEAPWSNWSNVIGYTPGSGETPGGGSYTDGTVTTSADGKTLTITCSGDVCNPDPANSSTFTTYKFQNLSANELYVGEEKSVVNNNDLFNPNKEYFTATPNYVSASIDAYDKYTIKEGVDNAYSYNETNKTYTKLSANADVTDALIKTISGEEETANLEGKTQYQYTFTGNYGGFLCEVTQHNPARIEYVDQGIFSDTKEYVWLKTGHSNWQINNYGVDSENPANDAEKRFLSKDWCTPITFEQLNTNGYIATKTYFIAESGVYKKDGSNYIDVSGTEKPADDTNTYYAGISFADAEKTNTELCASTPCVKTNGQDFYKGDGHTPVVNGEPKEDVTYYTLNGYDYNKIDPETLPTALVSNSKLAPVAPENYWEAMTNYIDANGFETVVFVTKEGEAKATICKHVTHAMMATTTVNALDLLDVQIDDIVGPDHEYTTDPKGTFTYPHDAYKNNETITILLLPEIKNEYKKKAGHKHVPSYCAENIKNLQLVVMPNNATCIEHHAFTNKATINTVILNEGLKMIGESAFDAARLNTLSIPESMEYIGINAFGAGYLHDVYFLGKTAPIVERDAFGSKAYVDNDSYIRPTMKNITGFDGTGPDKFNPEKWRLDRSHYISNDYMMAMLHLRTDLSDAERARFTDVSRDFHVFDLVLKDGENYVTVEEASPFKSTTTLEKVEANEGNRHVSVFWDGDENNTGSVQALGAFQPYALNNFDLPQYNSPDQWQNVTGYYDKILGHQYTWPNQADYCRSYTNATRNVLWDGKTNIATGITNKNGVYPTKDIAPTATNAYSTLIEGNEQYTHEIKGLSYDIDCDGTNDKTWYDGQEYIGIHQFVLVTGDVSPSTKTQEWDFNTIGGVNWWTICVPLDMTVAEVRSTFGDDTQVCKFNKVVRNKEDIIKFYFTDEQCYGKTDEHLNDIAIEANHAYMIRPSKYEGADTKFVLPQYTVSPQQIPVSTDVTAVLSNEENAETTSYTYRFIGQYNTQANGKPLQMPQYSYYLGKVKNSNPEQHKLFIASNTTTNWKPFTCVILPSDPQADYDDFFDPNRNNQKAKGMSCLFGENGEELFEETTSINYQIICGAENDVDAAIYNVNGQRVSNNSSKLAKGLYIQNGKKFIVK